MHPSPLPQSVPPVFNICVPQFQAAQKFKRVYGVSHKRPAKPQWRGTAISAWMKLKAIRHMPDAAKNLKEALDKGDQDALNTRLEAVARCADDGDKGQL